MLGLGLGFALTFFISRKYSSYPFNYLRLVFLMLHIPLSKSSLPLVKLLYHLVFADKMPTINFFLNKAETLHLLAGVHKSSVFQPSSVRVKIISSENKHTKL